MMLYVLDASFCASYIMPDENNELVNKFFLIEGKHDEFHVPHLWWYEMANIFRSVFLKKRHEYSEVLNFSSKLSKLSITSDSALGSVYTETLLRLTHDYGLTAYDAAYLELAGRKKAVLATLDDNLKAAAGKYGVVVF